MAKPTKALTKRTTATISIMYPTGTIQNEITMKTITYDQMEEQELL